jgi:tetratricopeptide (TPR) repeat protein
MQVLSNFDPGMDTLVMKPQRGAVSASSTFFAQQFSSSSLAPAERQSQTRESEVPELEVLMHQAKALIAKGNLECAETLYEQLCTSYPNSGKVWMKRFKLARSKRLYGKAREILQESLKHNPCNAILWQAWADLERSLGRINVARRLYRSVCLVKQK